MIEKPSLGFYFIVLNLIIIIFLSCWVIQPMWYSQAHFSLYYEDQPIYRTDWSEDLNRDYKKYMEKIQRSQQD